MITQLATAAIVDAIAIAIVLLASALLERITR